MLVCAKYYEEGATSVIGKVMLKLMKKEQNMSQIMKTKIKIKCGAGVKFEKRAIQKLISEALRQVDSEKTSL